MNITFNSDTVAYLIHELEDILSIADITAGMYDDMSNLLNALADIQAAGSIVIVPDDENLEDDWDDDDGYSPDPAPNGWDVAG